MVEDELQQRQKKRAEVSQCQDKLEGVHRITCLKRKSVGDATNSQARGRIPGPWLFGARGRQPGRGRPLSFFFEICRLSSTPAISSRFRPFFSPGSRISCDAGGFEEAGRTISESSFECASTKVNSTNSRKGKSFAYVEINRPVKRPSSGRKKWEGDGCDPQPLPGHSHDFRPVIFQ